MRRIAFIAVLFTAFILLTNGFADEKEKEKKEWVFFKLKYEKGMQFTKKITNSSSFSSVNEEGETKQKKNKKVKTVKIHIEEVEDNLPTKVKYEFGETKSYTDDKEDKNFDDKLKGHWIKCNVDKSFNNEITKKSDQFPDNDEAKALVEQIKNYGFLQFKSLKKIYGQVGDEWSDGLSFSSDENPPNYSLFMPVSGFIDSVEKSGDDKLINLSFSYKQESNDERMLITGTIQLNLSKSRINNWEFEIENKFKEDYMRFSREAEFSYPAEKKEEEEKKEDIKPKTDDE